MNLTSIAGYFDDTSIDVLRSDGVWQKNKFKGQIKLADDFISIFNRPTRRRMLTLSPANYKKLNGTVIRVRDADETFLIGNPQKDLGEGGTYRVTMPLNKSADIVDIERKQVTGVGEDVGVLVSSAVGSYHMDLELRTLTAEGETLNSTISKYFFWFPSDCPIKKDDEFTYDTENFRVLEAYNDTGFRGVRVTTEKDSRENLTYRQIQGEPVFNNTTGAYVTNYRDLLISAEVKEVASMKTGRSEKLFEDKIYTVLIESGHIGVIPTTKDLVSIDGTDRKILSAVRDRHINSWELTCQ